MIHFRKTAAALFALSLTGAAVPGGAIAHEGHMMSHNHPYPTKKFSVQRGKAIYNNFCASCHGIRGDGKGPAGPALKPPATNFLDMKYMPMRSRVDLFEVIKNGRPKTAMVPWKKTLTDSQIWDVVSYIGHLFNHRAENGSASR